MKGVHDGIDLDEGSMVLQDSFEWGEFDLGECLVPLKPTEFPKTNNTLRNVTQNTNGPLPPSPAIIKKKNSLTRLSSSPMDSPGSLSTAALSTAPATLNGRRSVRSSITNPLGGSLPGRGSSPGPLGGSRLGRRGGDKSRTRSNSPISPLVRSRSPGALGGSLHSRTTGPSALIGTGPGGIPLRRRSNSPGSLKSVSVHGTSTLRPRSRSPGAFQGRNRSFRLSRRMSLKSNKGPNGLVSILRKGKFSGDPAATATTTTATSATSSSSSLFSVPAPPPGASPPGSPACNSSSSHHRKRLLVGRRVTFWFPDEQSLACSFATEESMAFADLGFDDSGEGFGSEEGEEDDDDYLVKRFNGSTIHEELGMSFGEGNFTSFSSLPSDEDEEGHPETKKNKGSPALSRKEKDAQARDDSKVPGNRSPYFNSSEDDFSGESSQGSFALEDMGKVDTIDKTKKSKNLSKVKDKSKENRKSKGKNISAVIDDDEGSFALPDLEVEHPSTRNKSKNKKTKQNKKKVVDDHSEDDEFGLTQGSFSLPDDMDMPITRGNSCQSKKEPKKSKDKDRTDTVQDAYGDMVDDDVSHKKTKKNKKKDRKDEVQVALPDLANGKKTKKGKGKDKNDDAQESLGISQGSFTLPDLEEEDHISHKKAKKNKNKDVMGVEDNYVDTQGSFCVSQGSFALPDIGDDQVKHRTNKETKTTTSNNNNNKTPKLDSSDTKRDSFDENQDSFVSLVFAEDETLHKTNKSANRNKVNGASLDKDDDDDDRQESFGASQGSFALPESNDSSSLSCSPYHQYSHRGRNRQQPSIYCPLSRTRRRNPTPPPTLRYASRGAGSSSTISSTSFSSSLRLEEAILTPVRQKTSQQQATAMTSMTTPSSPWCCSESSLELSALRDSSKVSNRDSLSETSSESPTSVTELGGVSSQLGVGGGSGDDNGLNPIPVDDDDTEHRRLTVKRSMVSTLVPPIG